MSQPPAASTSEAYAPLSGVAAVPAAAARPGAMVARWWIYLMLFCATFLNFIDRQTLSIAAPLIKEDLALNNEQLGQLFSAFLYSYAIGQVIVGVLLDRYNIRWTYGSAVGLWSLAAVLTGLARGFWGLFGFRTLLGLFEAANWPAAARIIQRVTTPSERAFANGIMNSGMCLAALVSPVLLIWLFNLLGWRIGFALVGSLGFVWCAAWFWGTRHGRRLERAEAEHPPESQAENRTRIPWATILRAPRFYAILAASGFANAIFYFSANWITTYMVQTHQAAFSSRLSLLLAFVYLGMDLGYLGGGVAVMRLARRRGYDTQRARRVVQLAAMAIMGVAALIPLVHGAWPAAILLCLLNIGRGAWGSIFFTYTQEVSPDKIATLTALSGAAGALGGAVFVWFVGYAWDRGWEAVPFLVLGALPFLATLPLLITRDIPAKPQSA